MGGDRIRGADAFSNNGEQVKMRHWQATGIKGTVSRKFERGVKLIKYGNFPQNGKHLLTHRQSRVLERKQQSKHTCLLITCAQYNKRAQMLRRKV